MAVIVDYNLKMKDILEDYFQMIDEFDLITSTITNNKFTIDENDNEETKRKKENQKKKVLQDLGRILELAFKYILKLKRLEIADPQEPYISNNSKNNNGFREKETFPKPVVNDLANRCHIPQSKVDSDIYSVIGTDPPAHNFTYLYRIIEVILPGISKSMKDFFGYTLKSRIALEEIDDEFERPEYAVFPEDIWTEHRDKEQIDEETIKRIENRIKTINENGDIFTRLRYFSNNPNNKNFNVEEIYELTRDVVNFTKAIHLNNERLDLDSRLLFASFMISTNSEFSRFSQEETKKLINNKRIQHNPEILMDTLFYSRLPYNDVDALLSMKQIDESEYVFLFTSDVTIELVNYFTQKGIKNFEDIAYYTDCIRNTKEELAKLEIYRKENLDSDSNLYLINLISGKNLKTIQMFPELFEDNEFIRNISRGYLVSKKGTRK